jgi:hypothetical protein
MKKLSLAILSISLLSACNFFQNCIEADQEIVVQELDLDKIREISLASGVEVHIEQADYQKAIFEGPANYLEVLNQNVADEKWNIKFDRCLKSAETVKITLSLVELEAVKVNGSGKVIGNNIFLGDDLDLEIAGSGNIDLELDYKSLENEINGSGNIQLSGRVKSQEIEINGSGDVMALQLMSDNTEVEINGSGDVEVATSYSLKVEVNGSGDVKYVGSPKELSSEINGSGKLEQVN